MNHYIITGLNDELEKIAGSRKGATVGGAGARWAHGK